jgi:hypothetical protein
VSWFSAWLHCRRHPEASPETRELLARQTNLLARDSIVAAAEQRRAVRLGVEREANNFAKRLELHFRGEQ